GVQLLALKRAPRPAELVVSAGAPGGIGVPGGTSLHVSQVASISVVRNRPSFQSAVSNGVRPGNGPPAPGRPPRTPGSTTPARRSGASSPGWPPPYLSAAS